MTYKIENKAMSSNSEIHCKESHARRKDCNFLVKDTIA